MKLHCDHFYCIGSGHHVCQDFAVSGTNYAILSDGCSSAKDSEIGSMLLTKAAEQFIYQVNMMELAIHSANVYRRTLNLSADSLCATLLTIEVNDKSFVVNASGDGVIVARHRELGLVYYDLEYASGAPFYLKYLLDPFDTKTYLAEFPGPFIVSSNIEEWGKVHLKPQEQLEEIIFPFELYDAVGIFSDGVKSFYSKVSTGTTLSQQSITFQTILEEMFAFKGFNGDFVKRRCLKALRNYKKQNIDHYDDFSMAVVAITEGEENNAVPEM